MTITSVQAKVRKTAAFDGSSIDISAITGDWTLVLEVMDQDGTSPLTRFQFTDSVDAFTTPVAGPTASVSGTLGARGSTPAEPNTKRYTWQKRDFPSMRFGTGSAVLRLSLTLISGTSAGVTYQAWIES